MKKPEIVFVPVESKHVAAFAVGAYLGQTAVSFLIARRTTREIAQKDAIIADLTTLSTRLAGALDNFNPGVRQRIFQDLKFEQIIRGVDVDEPQSAE